MKKFARRSLAALGIVVGLVALVAVGAVLFVDVNRYKPQIEQAVYNASGLTLKINGRISLKLFPHIHVALADSQLSNRGSEVFAAREIQVAPRLLPYLTRRELIIDRISLVSPKVRIEKSASGHLNTEIAQQSPAQNPATGHKPSQGQSQSQGHVGSVVIRDGLLTFVDHGTGQRAEVDGVNIKLSEVSWNTASGRLARSVAGHGDLSAKSIKAGSVSVTDLKAHLDDRNGLVRLDPIELKTFGGAAHGSVVADVRGDTPKLAIKQTATGLDLAQALPEQKSKLQGTADLSFELTASGTTPAELERSAAGHGDVAAKSLKVSSVNVSDLKAHFDGRNGLIRLDPTELKALGAVVRGSAVADIRGAIPKLALKQTATGLDLAQAAPEQKNRLQGKADLAVDLMASGTTPEALEKSASGDFALRGQNIVVTHFDIDAVAAALKNVQGKDLTGIATLLGKTVVTEPTMQKNSVITKLVSVWKIDKGLAHTEDVALATAEHTLAFKGTINLVSQTYQGFTVATIDEKGCAKQKVAVEGSLAQPRPTTASLAQNLLKSEQTEQALNKLAGGKGMGQLAGPLGNLLGGLGAPPAASSGSPPAKRAPAGCDLFYSGAVLR